MIDVGDPVPDALQQRVVPAIAGRRDADHRVVAVGRDPAVGADSRRLGIAARRHAPYFGPEQLAQHQHALVGGGHVLERMHRDRPLAGLGVEIARDALAVLVGPRAVLAEEVDAFGAASALVGIFAGVAVRVEMPPADNAACLVVDRRRPAGDADPQIELRLLPVLPDMADLGDVAEDDVVRAHPDIVAPAPRGDVDHAGRRLAELRHRKLAPRIGELGEADPRVQEHGVRRVHHVLLHLEPVAGVGDVVGHQPVARHGEGIQRGEAGPLVRRSHIGEDQPVMLLDRVGAVIEPVLERARRRLARRLQNPAVGREQPAVIAAAQAPGLDDAVFERGPAMAAMQVEQPPFAAARPEQHQILAEHAHPERQLADLGGDRDGLPEAPQVLAAGRAALDMGELRVLLRHRRVVIRAVGRAQEMLLPGHPSSSSTARGEC